jgi:acylphosphatase
MAGVDQPAQRTVSVIVHGVVQGVGFRWFVRERARARRLVGWVRNREDGCVEFVVQGGITHIEELLALVKVGPRGAQVERLVMDELDSTADLPPNFDIRR